MNLTTVFPSKKNKTIYVRNYQIPFAKIETEKKLFVA